MPSPGASTIQIAPAIAHVAASITVLRRTMPYIMEKSRAPMPRGRLAWAFWRIAYELRNDLYTSFDGTRRVDWLPPREGCLLCTSQDH